MQPSAQAIQELAEHQADLHACRRCQEAGFSVQGPAVVAGGATARLLLVGQAPARIDLDRGGQPWSGVGGKRLMGWLARAGFEPTILRQEAYFAALTRCYPGRSRGGKGDRVPSRPEIALCRPYLLRELELLQPALLIAIGGLAITEFLGAGTLEKRIGQVFQPTLSAGRLSRLLAPSLQVLPLPHPSGASTWLNQPANQARLDRAVELLAQLKERWFP